MFTIVNTVKPGDTEKFLMQLILNDFRSVSGFATVHFSIRQYIEVSLPKYEVFR